MTQATAVRSWWAELDQVDRGRVLRMDDDDLLAEDLATGLMMHGVTVLASTMSPVDGRPEGWFWPPVLEELVAELRGDPAPYGPGGRLCQECGEAVEDGQEYIVVPLAFALACVVHVQCVSTADGDLPGP